MIARLSGDFGLVCYTLNLVNQLAVPFDWFYLICGSVRKGIRINVDWDKSPVLLHRHCDKDNHPVTL